MFNIEALLEAQLQTPCQLGDGGVAVRVVGEGGHVRVGLENKGADHADHVLAILNSILSSRNLSFQALLSFFFLCISLSSIYLSSILSFSSFFTHNVSSKSSHNHVF